MWPFRKKPMSEADRKFEEYEAMQKDFFETAHLTIDLTKDITNKLKGKMDSYLRHIETTANILSDALIVINSLGIIQRINPAGEKMFGWNQDDLRGKRVTHLFTTNEGRSITFEKLMEILSREKCFDLGVVMDGTVANIKGFTKDTHSFAVDISGSSYINAEGEETLLLLIRDVTLSEKLKEDLKKSEEHYRAIFETSFDAIGILKDFKVIEANKSFKSLFGPKNVKTLDFRKFVIEDYLEQFETAHERHMDGEDCSFEFEISCKKHDGKSIDVIFSSALVGSENNEYASLITLKDITFRKLMENKIKESEQKYKNIFEQSFNSVVVVQANKIVAVNPAFCKIVGLSRNQLINKNFIDLIDETSMEEVTTAHTNRMNGSLEMYRYILKINTPDGLLITSATSNHVIWNGDHACLLNVTLLE